MNANSRKGIIIKKLAVRNSYKYLGGTRNEKKEGFGIQKWNDESKYIGLYRDDYAEGFGKFRFGDKKILHCIFLIKINFFRLFQNQSS